jgi:hypothetical protein
MTGPIGHYWFHANQMVGYSGYRTRRDNPFDGTGIFAQIVATKSIRMTAPMDAPVRPLP